MVLSLLMDILSFEDKKRPRMNLGKNEIWDGDIVSLIHFSEICEIKVLMYF